MGGGTLIMEQTLGGLEKEIVKLSVEFKETFSFIMDEFWEDEHLALKAFILFWRCSDAIQNLMKAGFGEDFSIINNHINEKEISQARSLLDAAKMHLRQRDPSISFLDDRENIEREEDVRIKMCSKAILIAQEVVDKMEAIFKQRGQ